MLAGMTRVVSWLTVGLVVMVGATHARAWGPEGHAVVAIVAERHLSEDAKAGVTRLLGPEGLPAVANWADEIRQARRETGHWHFVDIELTETTYRPSHHCQPTPTGDCLIAALERVIRTLKDRRASVVARTEALKFVVHLVADLHQPLHCADNHDHGGNDVPVTFFRELTNLHRVWDSGLIYKTGVREYDYAGHVEGWLAQQDTDTLAKGAIVEWAVESHRVAVEHVYGDLPQGGHLAGAYYDQHIDIVDHQLGKAGVRLAKVLNDAFRRTRPDSPMKKEPGQSKRREAHGGRTVTAH